MSSRTAFLLERQQRIGGSDAGSLLSNVLDVEYGCERNLWARLSGIPDDNPDQETELMAVGNICEPYIRKAYADITGRRVSGGEGKAKAHATHATLQVHEDGIIHPAPDDRRTTNGVLEIKTVGREMMAKIHAEGLPVDYVLQLNHGMACHGLNWGAFAIGVRDDLLPLIAMDLTGRQVPRRWRITHFEMERDEDIIRAIEERGPAFFATVGDPTAAPPRLRPDDPRCGRCPRRIWCQGAAVMDNVHPDHALPQRPDLAPLVEEYRTNMALLEQVEELVKETEDKFREALGPDSAVRAPVDGGWASVIYRVRQGSERVNGNAMIPQYDLMRSRLLELDEPLATLIAPSYSHISKGMPSRPLLLKTLLPKKEKRKGDVPEMSDYNPTGG